MSDKKNVHPLLQPLTIGDMKLKNRLVLAPLTRARCTPQKDPLDMKNTIPNELMEEYYEQRATAGLVITEATAISEMGSGWLNAPHMRNEEHVAAWKKVVDRVHKKGGKIFLQLWHMGRQAHSSFHPTTNDIVSASAIKIGSGNAKNNKGENVEWETPRALTTEEVESTVQDFKAAAALAKKAGFDGVEIHSANGYLIDQFLQSSTNKRTDKYGGSMANRFRFLKEVIEACMEVYSASRIGYRLSPNGVYGGVGSIDNNEMFPYVAKETNKYGLAYMHVMDGLGFGYHGLCPVVTCADLRKYFDGTIITNVGLTVGTAEGMLRSGAADLACFGRLYISNPDLPERIANDWPLEKEASYETWWQPTGAKGYTDWPTYKAPEGKKAESA
mmetsp:Transcript_19675/g.48094  ORF Transcript_19675/g.48094 Transcript_19675/m.48094 type:complete len:387 (-) Transcript_19675:348-1508(-)|eukprot:CAMPEP_0114505090 /NCGR_PEP_ID=MMETSP0109-20121206/10657_1 /TAXON_ID=29199 /ORGANISM="Chlorarachnion reptans, Strain CCCM449" /LENGTH=386 /DNA_ID=CAMNT_0001683485 /DNA_START=94 /DNA_END=1254 /DNA_ORIENTATION=+